STLVHYTTLFRSGDAIGRFLTPGQGVVDLLGLGDEGRLCKLEDEEIIVLGTSQRLRCLLARPFNAQLQGQCAVGGVVIVADPHAESLELARVLGTEATRDRLVGD